MVTFALNSAKKSKCFLRSVARMASMTRKRKRLNSTCSRLTRKLYSGRDMKRFHAEAAWWFSNTERSLYRRACSGRPRGERHIHSCYSTGKFLRFTFTASFRLRCGPEQIKNTINYHVALHCDNVKLFCAVVRYECSCFVAYFPRG